MNRFLIKIVVGVEVTAPDISDARHRARHFVADKLGLPTYVVPAHITIEAEPVSLDPASSSHVYELQDKPID
jgi:hypothetical protein